MVRSLPFPLVVASAGVLAALVFGCAIQPELVPPRPVAEISIDISGCTTDEIDIIVRPWTAWVARGRPFRWDTPAGVDSVAIQAKDPAHWPFQWGPGSGDQSQQSRQQPPRQRRSARGGQPIQAGTVPANLPIGQSYSYRILVYCGDRVIDIDPDFIVRDPY